MLQHELDHTVELRLGFPCKLLLLLALTSER
jgi:hypothetical protein